MVLCTPCSTDGVHSARLLHTQARDNTASADLPHVKPRTGHALRNFKSCRRKRTPRPTHLPSSSVQGTGGSLRSLVTLSSGSPSDPASILSRPHELVGATNIQIFPKPSSGAVLLRQRVAKAGCGPRVVREPARSPECIYLSTALTFYAISRAAQGPCKLLLGAGNLLSSF